MQLALRLGFDASDAGDLREVAAALRWARAQQSAAEQAEIDRATDRRERRGRLRMFGYTLASLFAGGIVTWLISHPPSWFPL